MATPYLGLTEQSAGDPNWEVAIEDNWNTLDTAIGLSGSGDPNGAVAGDFVGQLYYRTDTEDIYRCTLVGAVGVATWEGLLDNNNQWQKSQSGLWVSKTSTPVNLDLAEGHAFHVDVSVIASAVSVNFPTYDGGGLPADLDIDFKIFFTGDVSAHSVTFVDGAGSWLWPNGAAGDLSGANALDAFGFFVTPAGDVAGAYLQDLA
jgi:hypothetical protein